MLQTSNQTKNSLNNSWTCWYYENTPEVFDQLSNQSENLKFLGQKTCGHGLKMWAGVAYLVFVYMTQPMGIYVGHDTGARGYQLRTYHTDQTLG